MLVVLMRLIQPLNPLGMKVCVLPNMGGVRYLKGERVPKVPLTPNLTIQLVYSHYVHSILLIHIN